MKRYRFMVGFTLTEKELHFLSRICPTENGCPDTDELLKLWEAITMGRSIGEVHLEPDYEAWDEFCSKVEQLWEKIKITPLEQLAECAE